MITCISLASRLTASSTLVADKLQTLLQLTCRPCVLGSHLFVKSPFSTEMRRRAGLRYTKWERNLIIVLGVIRRFLAREVAQILLVDYKFCAFFSYGQTLKLLPLMF